MDITSFILGLQKGKSMNESGDVSELKWVRRSGSFISTETTHVVTHNIGKIPDIVMITLNILDIIEPPEGLDPDTNSYGINAFIVSNALFESAIGEKHYGSTMMYHPGNHGFLVGNFQSGIEESANGEWLIAGADAQTITFGGRLGKLLPDGKSYTWSAYALV